MKNENRKQEMEITKQNEIKRDEEMISKLDQGYKEFVEDMDLMLKTMGMEFGQQWNQQGNK